LIITKDFPFKPIRSWVKNAEPWEKYKIRRIKQSSGKDIIRPNSEMTTSRALINKANLKTKISGTRKSIKAPQRSSLNPFCTTLCFKE
jgi:hypothetical protein